MTHQRILFTVKDIIVNSGGIFVSFLLVVGIFMIPLAQASYEASTIQRLAGVELAGFESFMLLLVRLGFCCCLRTRELKNLENNTEQKMEEIFDPVFPYLPKGISN